MASTFQMCARLPSRGYGCASGIQEHRDVTDEHLWVLVLRAVAGVGVEDQLGVGDVLLQDERVHGVDDHVLAAVHDQRRLADRLQIFERLLPRRAPFADGLDLSRRDFLVNLGIAVLATQPEPLEELAARSLALLGAREVHAKPKMIGLVIGGAEDFLRLRLPSPLRGPVPTTSFCTVGAPLTPMAPTISPSTLIGKPPPYAATRVSVGMPAKSDGSRWIKLKKSCVETPNRAV